MTQSSKCKAKKLISTDDPEWEEYFMNNVMLS